MRAGSSPAPAAISAWIAPKVRLETVAEPERKLPKAPSRGATRGQAPPVALDAAGGQHPLQQAGGGEHAQTVGREELAAGTLLRSPGGLPQHDAQLRSRSCEEHGGDGPGRSGADHGDVGRLGLGDGAADHARQPDVRAVRCEGTDVPHSGWAWRVQLVALGSGMHHAVRLWSIGGLVCIGGLMLFAYDDVDHVREMRSKPLSERAECMEFLLLGPVGGLGAVAISKFVHLREGHRRRRVAEVLEIGEQAVKDHLVQIYQKLGVASRSELSHVVFPL